MDIGDLIKEAKKHHPVDADKIRAAFEFAQKAHAGQTRMSGEPYITHPLEVAMILTKFGADEETIITALLHDVVEDTAHTLNEVEKMFGKEVSKMVDSLTKLPHVMPIDMGTYQQFDTKVESIRKIFEVMQDDVRVIIIKLCDRLHNMETLQHFRPEKQKRIAQETLSIYVKIADRLCVMDLKEALEEISYSYLFPNQYQEIQQLKKRELPRFEKLEKKLTDKLEVSSNKLVIRQHVPYQRIIESDFEHLEVRTEVYMKLKNEDECYKELHHIHSLWKNIRGSFQDYITLPKSNGYQGLETSVYLDDGSVAKFIIQTDKMYEYYRFGVMLEAFSSSHHDRKIRLPWVESLKKIHKETRNQSSDYMTALENDILRGSIIVYTDDNKTLFLPPESTALDAAFFYDSKRAPLTQKIFIGGKQRNFSTFLHDGDKLHFEWGESDQIDYEWLSKVNTAFSKSIIYDFVQRLSTTKKASFGQNILQEELSKRGFGYADEVDEKNIRRLFKPYNVSSRVDLYHQIAEGAISGSRAAELIFASQRKSGEERKALYELQMELLPGKYGALSSLLKTFDTKGAALKNIRFNPSNGTGMVVKAEIALTPSSYDIFVRSLKGLSDLRFVSLQDLKRVKIGSGLLAVLVLLVALDPVIASYLLHDLNIYAFDLLTVRFFSVFLLASIVLFFRKIRTGYIEESEISINNKYFFLSVIALFSTAFFTYLALERAGSPFFYQFSIYLLFFPFMAVQLQQYSKMRILAFSGFLFALYGTYLGYLFQYKTIDPIFILYVGIVSISFIVYTQASIIFQREQHIHRRYLSFFKILSFYAVLMSLIPHFFRGPYELPDLYQLVAAFLFSVIFIFVPYILYFIITGIYGYTVSLWRKIIFILPIIVFGEIFILGHALNKAEIVLSALFILAYYIYSKPYRSMSPSTNV